MYMSKRHQEGLAHLLYGIEFGGGFVALTGEVGTGKTTLCHCLLKQLPQNIDLALILNSRLNSFELVATLCDELGISYDKTTQSLKVLIDQLNQHLLLTHAKGRQTVLLIDEAQNLSMEVLEQLRLLTNLETTKTKLLRIILVGQPELKELLQKQDLRQLNQRITARYHLLPLSLNETRAYIRHRLSISQGDVYLFNDSAIKRIFKLTKGIPRLINLLCDRSLLGAYATHVYKVNAGIVNHAAVEILPSPPLQSSFARTLFFTGIIVFLALSAYLYQTNNNIKALFLAENSLTTGSVPISTKVDINSISETKKIRGSQIPEHNVLSEIQNPELKLLSESKIIAESSKPLPVIPFTVWLTNPAHTLENVLKDTIKDWGKVIQRNQKVDCSSIQLTGLRCQIGKASWKDILKLKKPVILEFVLNNNSKFHALVTGFSEQQTLIHFDNDVKFPVTDILKYWEGYYLTIEAPELKAVRIITYKQNSENVLWLRYVLNSFDRQSTQVVNPQYYDDNLLKRVQNYQKERNLGEDGKVGPSTLISLKNYAHKLEYSHLRINE